MSDFLRLTTSSVEYGTGELTVFAKANAFQGQSSAWFHLHELEALASALEAYPLSKDNLPKLAGGYWKKDKDELEQEHLYLSFYPVGLLGQVGVRVKLVSPFLTASRPESRHAVELEFLTTYQQLSVFAKELHRLATEEANEAELYSRKN